MELVTDLKRAICALFEVHADESGMQRVVTPLEYSGSGDRIVVRVRPRDNGFLIDENGEAAFFATMAGGDTDSGALSRWAEDLAAFGPAKLGDDEVISAFASDVRLVAPYVFRVAEAAQQLHAIATSRAERQVSDFKQRVADVVNGVARGLGLRYQSDVELPISGGLIADHLIEHDAPLIVIAATSATRLLEAEVIHMQYRMEKKPGFVLAVVENQMIVGKKQFERANYYTGKTVTYSAHDLGSLISTQLQ
ncbi:hypothetical protein PEP31012_03581 [Pandoraea eparura]|uniref:DUF1828 domain-containing protein n=1 Tax=Pandoraea eparura TaxID=2508291 RepID=A0A5E4WZJ7_9BURK|nr:hypothetical protein [Pandoraea eparura]VVE29266.1 hypothetical protein PEP31012_03581 [Pandoraea eparura]